MQLEFSPASVFVCGAAHFIEKCEDIKLVLEINLFPVFSFPAICVEVEAVRTDNSALSTMRTLI